MNKHCLKCLLIFVTVLFVGGGALALGAGYLVGDYFVNYALKRNIDNGHSEAPSAILIIGSPLLFSLPMPDIEHESWHYTSLDGLNLVATHFFPQGYSHHWAILVHGYGRSQGFAWDYTQPYIDQDFNVLTPDLRASGESEGTYLTMGVKEGEDIVGWVQKIVALDPDAKIVLHGVSMGAATVMLAAASPDMPKNVTAVIEDCGYTNAYDLFGEQLEKNFNLPRFPIMNCVDAVSEMRTGAKISDASPLTAVAQSDVPMMFIHGTDDDLVPVSMMEELYQHSAAKLKERVLLDGVNHALAMPHDREAYFAHIFDFVEKAEEQPPQ